MQSIYIYIYIYIYIHIYTYIYKVRIKLIELFTEPSRLNYFQFFCPEYLVFLQFLF